MMFGLPAVVGWLAVFGVGFVAGALVWRRLTFRWIKEIETRWNDENADLRNRWRTTQARLDELRNLQGRSEAKPIPVEPPQLAADDLTLLKGVGPKIATRLNEIGVTNYAQIAAWTPVDIDRIEGQLRQPGRASRYCWVEHARQRIQRESDRSEAA